MGGTTFGASLGDGPGLPKTTPSHVTKAAAEKAKAAGRSRPLPHLAPPAGESGGGAAADELDLELQQSSVVEGAEDLGQQGFFVARLLHKIPASGVFWLLYETFRTLLRVEALWTGPAR